MNNKYSGNVSDFQPVVEDASRVVISYGLKALEGDKAEWYEVVFYKKQGKPTIEQVKAAVLADINERVKAKIVGGFVWNDQPIWLSEENQVNWAQAVCPATFKIGEQADGTPIYHEFETKEEMNEFFAACIQWKQQCLADGWTDKDAIDWTPYEQVLNPEKDTKKKTSKKSK